MTFMIKTLKKLGIEEDFLNLEEGIYKKPTAKIILNGEILGSFSLSSGIRQGCMLLSLQFDAILEVQPEKLVKKKKDINVGKEEV